jgi:hypothetical protein
MADAPKQDLLRELGFGGDVAAYELALSDAGLSRPSKPRIHLSKRDDVERVLLAGFRRVCGRGDCQRAASEHPDGRTVVPASAQEYCEICGGSANRAAVDRMIAACRRTGWARLCIVGGSANTRRELKSLIAGRLDLRLVEGAGVRRTLRDAAADLHWTDLAVVWGATELDHKVSTLYRGEKVLTVHRRGIAHLADEVARSAGLPR